MALFAHAGHWLVQLAYFVPVVLFLLWLGFTVLRERRAGSEPPGEATTPDQQQD
jgi:membrane protein implicated in regulation of membrane protease activity